jgi:hypothetical protein
MAQDNGSGDENDEGEDGHASGKDSGEDSAEDDDEHDRKRRIVDFTVDDPDWEDMQDMLYPCQKKAGTGE